MALVMSAALCMAALFLLFKVFDKRNIALLPAIVINYFTASLCGTLVSPPWQAGDLTPLALPVMVLGVLFITLFYLTGLSTQRAGVAVTSLSSKMSLVLTVLAAVLLHGERPSAVEWMGIALALAGVVMASWSSGAPGARGVWLLPLLLFLGNAAIDITLNATQRTLLTPATEPVFPTLIFMLAGLLGVGWMLAKRTLQQLCDTRVIIAGVVLGLVNYASLYFIVGALARSGLAASSVFPLMNIGVIFFGTLASMLLFKERLRAVQWVGLACALIALVLILSPGT